MAENVHALVVPKWGLSMTEGTLVAWSVPVGATVQSGDVIAEIETEKIVNELEVHVGGVLKRQIASEGDVVPVGGLIGVVAGDDVSDDVVEEFVRRHGGGALGAPAAAETGGAQAENAEEFRASEQPEATRLSTSKTRVPEALMLGSDQDNPANANATHIAKKLARARRIDLGKIDGTGRRGRISVADIERALGASGGRPAKAGLASASATDAGATPSARRLAEEHGIELDSLSGTGRRGRISKKDVLAALESTQAGEAASADYRVVSLGNRRKIIARRMLESKRSAPHFRVAIDARIDALLERRRSLNEDGRDQRVSVNDVLVKAVGTTLTSVPEMNVQFDGNELRQYDDADVAIAVATRDGLITPIVRKTNRKSVDEISYDTVELIGRAKDGRLRAEDIEGGTFTVSNLGMFGIDRFDAIINPPQIAILAVGAARKRRIFVADEEAVATVISMTLSCDHRIVDGLLGARFIHELKNVIEKPDQLFS